MNSQWAQASKRNIIGSFTSFRLPRLRLRGRTSKWGFRLLRRLVGHLSLVAVDGVGGEANDLESVVGEENRILALHVRTVAVFHMAESVAIFIVFHRPFEVVGHRHHGGGSRVGPRDLGGRVGLTREKKEGW